MIDISYKNIIKLAFPVMIGMVMHLILGFADRFFIAKMGVDEAAGSSLSGTLYWLLITFTALVSAGTTAIVSRKIGEKSDEEAILGASQSILLAIFFGAVFLLIGEVTADTIFKFFNASENVTKIGVSYYKVMLFATPMMFLSIVISSIFQAAGDTKTPMIVFAVMSLVNVFANPIFMFGGMGIPAMGVTGAAWGTVLAEFFGFVWIFYRLYKFEKLKFKISNLFKIDILMMKRVMKIGVWGGLNGFSRPLSALVLQRIVSFHGTSAIAAFSFGIQWISLFFIFFEGIRVAISTLSGQLLGAKRVSDVDTIIKRGLKLGFVVSVFLVFFFFVFSETGISIFSTDSLIIKMGSDYLKIVSISLFLAVPLIVSSAVFMGSGDTIPPMVVSFLANWGIKVGFAWSATYIFPIGVKAIWLGIAIALTFEGIVLYLWLLRGKWRTKVV